MMDVADAVVDEGSWASVSDCDYYSADCDGWLWVAGSGDSL